MRALGAVALAALACSGGRSILLVEVSAPAPGINLTAVEITATPAGGSAVIRTFAWNSASGMPLEAGLYLPGSVDGPVAVRAAGMDAVGHLEANGPATVKPGQVSERVTLALRRVSPPPDGDGGVPPGDDGGSPPDGASPPDAGAGAEAAAPPDGAPPDAAPVDPPSLTRCLTYEHAEPCTITPTAAGVGVWDVRFSPDGQFLLTGGGNARLKVWRVTPTGLVDDNRTLSGAPANTTVVTAFSADGTRLAVGQGDGSIGIYEFPKLTRIATLPTGKYGIEYLAFSADGTRVVSIDTGPDLQVWDPATVRMVIARPLPSDFHAASLSPAGQPGSPWLAISYTVVHSFSLTDLAADPLEAPLFNAGDEVFALAFTRDGRRLAVSTADGKTALWDVSNKQKPAQGAMLWPGGAATTVQSVVSPDGRFLVTAGSTGMFGAGEIRIGTLDPPGLRATAMTESSVVSVDVSPDGRAVVGGSWRCGKITYCRD